MDAGRGASDLLPLLAVVALAAYATGLFALAQWVERRGPAARRLVAHPATYALSLSVYCTAWTYYGSVGMATTSGLLFTALFLGPSLGALLWWTVLSRCIRLKNAFHLTSIADLLAARFGKSPGVAALAAGGALVGLTPYIALQLKSVIGTFAILTGVSGGDALALGVCLAMTILTIACGARRLDPYERHPGLVAVAAADALVKLAALTAVGLFVVFVLGDGPLDILNRASAGGELPALGREQGNYLLWTTYLVLAMAASFMLPRQFHLAVVENADEGHVRTAQWLFPLYLLAINLFVLPIALYGRSLALPAGSADTLVLDLPLGAGRPMLALFVFLGGFSAAATMVMVSTTALATMATNHLLLPLINRPPALAFLRRRLLMCRWAVIAGIIGLAFAFERHFGHTAMLAGLGMISFAAALQFVPPVLAGVFGRGASTRGAALGLGGGFSVWFWTLVVPTMARAGWLPPDLPARGPFGLSFLAPEHLLGLTGLDPLSHGVFWSLLANIGLLTFGSLLFEQSEAERRLSEEFVRGHAVRPVRPACWPETPADIELSGKRAIILSLIADYFSPLAAATLVDRCIATAGLAGRERITVLELAALHKAVETVLSGSLGAAAAHRAMNRGTVVSFDESASLSEIYGRLMAELKLPPAELIAKIDYHREREAFMRRQSQELEACVAERTSDLKAKAAELTRANARLRELDRLKSAFLSSVSHELRTPLTSILGFSKLLSRDFARHFAPLAAGEQGLSARAGRMAENLRIISQEGERLTRLINDVLDLSRIEEGRLVWRDSALSLGALVNEAVAATAGLLSGKPHLRLCMELAPGLPEVLADRDRLLQVLLNILNNAVKFTAAGEIRVRTGPADGGGVRLSVKDTGPGIPAEARERVFDEFYQVVRGDTLLNKPEGTGLGLAICRQIIEHYAGRIWVESESGRGCEFVIELPAEATRPARGPAAERCAPPADGPRRPLVLVVDDDPAVRRYLVRLLTDAGYATAEAGDGEEALAVARACRPDLVTMDLMMPGMDGRTAIARLRAGPELARVPVIVVSVLSETAGADAALTKPVDENLLLGTVRRLLEGFADLPQHDLLAPERSERAGAARFFLFPEAGGLPEPAAEVGEDFSGAVLVPAHSAGSLDLARLAARPDLQLVIMPDEPEQAEACRTPGF